MKEPRIRKLSFKAIEKRYWISRRFYPSSIWFISGYRERYASAFEAYQALKKIRAFGKKQKCVHTWKKPVDICLYTCEDCGKRYRGWFSPWQIGIPQ